MTQQTCLSSQTSTSQTVSVGPSNCEQPAQRSGLDTHVPEYSSQASFIQEPQTHNQLAFRFITQPESPEEHAQKNYYIPDPSKKASNVQDYLRDQRLDGNSTQ